MALTRLEPPSLPAGSVLQVAQTSLTSEISTTSASYVTSGLTATLTPSSAASDVYKRQHLHHLQVVIKF